MEKSRTIEYVSNFKFEALSEKIKSPYYVLSFANQRLFSQGRQGRKFGVTQVAAVLNFVIENSSKAVKVLKVFYPTLFKVHTSVLESDAIEE